MIEIIEQRGMNASIVWNPLFCMLTCQWLFGVLAALILTDNTFLILMLTLVLPLG